MLLKAASIAICVAVELNTLILVRLLVIELRAVDMPGLTTVTISPLEP
jgi:hypothetical protein